MYNRYIPEDASYVPVEPPRPSASASASAPRPAPRRQPAFRWNELTGLLKGGEGGGLWKTLHLDGLDAGDILLMLIMLYLLVEGDDLEPVIALGLVLLMGLGVE